LSVLVVLGRRKILHSEAFRGCWPTLIRAGGADIDRPNTISI
jgi:hypothetical protein